MDSRRKAFMRLASITFDYFAERTKEKSDARSECPIRMDRVGTLTLPAVIEYFTDNQPVTDAQTRWALLKQTGEAGKINLLQIYLGEDEKPVIDQRGAVAGRQIIARAIEPELEAAFQDRDLIVWENAETKKE